MENKTNFLSKWQIFCCSDFPLPARIIVKTSKKYRIIGEKI